MLKQLLTGQSLDEHRLADLQLRLKFSGPLIVKSLGDRVGFKPAAQVLQLIVKRVAQLVKLRGVFAFQVILPKSLDSSA